MFAPFRISHRHSQTHKENKIALITQNNNCTHSNTGESNLNTGEIVQNNQTDKNNNNNNKKPTHTHKNYCKESVQLIWHSCKINWSFSLQYKLLQLRCQIPYKEGSMVPVEWTVCEQLKEYVILKWLLLLLTTFKQKIKCLYRK